MQCPPDESTEPVGLCGEFRTMAFVFSVFAARTFSQSIRYEGNSSVTATGMAPFTSDIRNITIITGSKNNHFITRLKNGTERCVNRIGAAGCDRDFSMGMNFVRIEVFNFIGQCLEQWRMTRHGCILVDNHRASLSPRVPPIQHPSENQETPVPG